MQYVNETDSGRAFAAVINEMQRTHTTKNFKTLVEMIKKL